jgi:hypothetical protein
MKDKDFVSKERLDIKHPKSVKGWKDLDDELKKTLEEAAKIFAENAVDVLKKLSEE